MKFNKEDICQNEEGKLIFHFCMVSVIRAITQFEVRLYLLATLDYPTYLSKYNFQGTNASF